jgi:hypothetical protein
VKGGRVADHALVDLPHRSARQQQRLRLSHQLSHRLHRRLSSHRSRQATPPKWWQELGFIAVVYYLYSLVRNAVPSHEVAARHRAGSVLSIERFLHVDAEHAVNLFVAHHGWLAQFCDYYYSTLHFVVTIGVLVWLFARHPLRYRSIRSVLLITNLVALLGFWLLPLAPPRMLSGFVDTVVHFNTWGSWATTPDVAKESNQFAAMPSLHIGWSLWCALAVIALTRRRWVRLLAVAYPVLTCFVILGTANHYLLDAVGGVVALGLAVAAQRLLFGRPAFRSESEPVALPEPEPELVAA